VPGRIEQNLRGLYQLLWRKYYIDELYDHLVSRPLFWISLHFLNNGVDRDVIDGMVNGTGAAVEGSGEAARKIETGNVQNYAFVYLLGVVAVAGYYVYLVMR
jgi:NADH-quinone oxidoreductase subunit L